MFVHGRISQRWSCHGVVPLFRHEGKEKMPRTARCAVQMLYARGENKSNKIKTGKILCTYLKGQKKERIEIMHCIWGGGGIKTQKNKKKQTPRAEYIKATFLCFFLISFSFFLFNIINRINLFIALRILNVCIQHEFVSPLRCSIITKTRSSSLSFCYKSHKTLVVDFPAARARRAQTASR